MVPVKIFRLTSYSMNSVFYFPGLLCGSCKNGTGVSVLLNKCVSCSNGYIAFLVGLGEC